ncbi:MAG: hypothetical protein K9L17_09310 [Clostridiales bacterium]|nr:hypothetical protein [Clostridiales bacterium]MCF8022876.1 hypothetical protein [Clostridiales bacterium]
MKKHILIILAAVGILVAFSFSCTACLASEAELPYDFIENAVHQEMKAKGFEESYVAIEDGNMLMRMEVPVVDSSLSGHMVELAAAGFLNYPTANNVRVESYHMGNPLFRAAASGSDLGNYVEQKISVEELVSRFQFEDLRAPETVVEHDLGVFNVLIGEVALDDKKASVDLEYLGDSEKEFWSTFFSMAMLVVEDCPWIETVEFNFHRDSEEDIFTVKASAEDVLAVTEGSMSPEKFIDNFEDQNEGGIWGFLLITLLVLLVFIIGVITIIRKGIGMLKRTRA